MTLQTIGIVAVVILLLFLVPIIKLLKKPLKWALKLLIHAASGYIALLVLNFFGGIVGLSIEITWVSAIIVGILGLPGVILLLIMKYIP